MPLAFPMFVYCLSVCVCVCVCLHSISAGSLATTKQIPRLLTCVHVYICVFVCMCSVLTACCLVYFFVYDHSCFYGFFATAFWLWLLYLCGRLARARSPASYGKSSLCVRVCVCVCMSMHVYETSCAWTFCFMVCLCCLFILLNSLVFIVFPSFVAAFIFFVYFFFLHIIFYQTLVVVIKLWLLSNCLYWLEDFTWVLNKVLFLNELVFRNRKLITMSAVTLAWQIVIGQVLPKVSAVNDWNFQ